MIWSISVAKTKVFSVAPKILTDNLEEILTIINQHLKLEKLVIQTGSTDVAKKLSEVLKGDLSDLLQRHNGLSIHMCIGRSSFCRKR